MGYTYLAAPYTHRDPEVVRERVRLSALAVARLLQEGDNPYSPIVHGYAVEVWISYALPYDVWLRHGLALLKKASVCCVLTLEGWHESHGVQKEIALALEWGIPVVYLNPADWCKRKEIAT